MNSTTGTTSTRYFKLGLFILSAVGITIAGAVTLGAGRMFTKSIAVETTFDESVAGLEVGAPVKHRGVTIGHVQSIRFPREFTTGGGGSAAAAAAAEPFKYILVEMAVDPKVVSDVTENRLKPTLDRMVAAGLRARITQSGITGSAYVELNYLDPARYPISKVPVRTGPLFVPSAPGALNQVVDAVTDIATKLQRADLDQVVRHVDSLIVHMDQSVQDLQVAELRTKTSAILDHVKSASARLAQILYDPKLAQVISDLPEISGRVRSLAGRADDLVKDAKLDQSAAHLQHTLAAADELLASQSDNVRAILSDLRAAIANARALTDDIKSNPSRLFFGQPPQRAAYGNSK
jgi:phospholipid/cholesterol/gamma-HCH transport system substrate-binding protein/paraquat-inducible protein B